MIILNWSYQNILKIVKSKSIITILHLNYFFRLVEEVISRNLQGGFWHLYHIQNDGEFNLGKESGEKHYEDDLVKYVCYGCDKEFIVGKHC